MSLEDTLRARAVRRAADASSQAVRTATDDLETGAEPGPNRGILVCFTWETL